MLACSVRFSRPPRCAFSLFTFFLLLLRRPLTSTLFPYTTLFRSRDQGARGLGLLLGRQSADRADPQVRSADCLPRDRKSTRLNSSHRCISYAVFCLKKKKIGRYS